MAQRVSLNPSFVIYISGAQFKQHCFNISGVIHDWVLCCSSGTIFWCQYFPHLHNKKCEALEPVLTHSCRSLSQFLLHEVARSISTPPGRDASPSQVTPP